MIMVLFCEVWIIWWRHGADIAGTSPCWILHVSAENPADPAKCLVHPPSPTHHLKSLSLSEWIRCMRRWRKACSEYASSFSHHYHIVILLLHYGTNLWPDSLALPAVFNARLSFIRCCLQVHQMDLDNLSRQMRESKRNSRLVRSDHDVWKGNSPIFIILVSVTWTQGLPDFCGCQYPAEFHEVLFNQKL